MTRIEQKSYRKAKAIKLLVEDGEYSIAYAIMLTEQLNDEGKILDDDYDWLMKWLEERLGPEELQEEEVAGVPLEDEAEDPNPIQYEVE